MGRRPLPGAKRRILEAALEAFNYDGIRGVSADTIINRAGVAKMTFYKYFPTKDDLAAAFVRERSDRWIAWLTDRVSRPGYTPLQRVLALFDAQYEWFGSKDYFGCPFHRAAAEFPDTRNPIHVEVLRNKRQLRELVTDLAKAASLDDRSRIVDALLLLMAGAEVMTNIDDNKKYARYAQQAARRLIRR